MNKRTFFILITILVITFPSCTAGLETETQKDVKTIKLNINLDEEKKLQTEVDNGHQPWRLEPIDVAYAIVIAKADKNVVYENCSPISIANTEAKVVCKSKGAKKYFVNLKRIVRPDGIWTAISIEESTGKGVHG